MEHPHLSHHVVAALLVVGAHRAMRRVGKQLASVRVERTSRLASPAAYCRGASHTSVPLAEWPALATRHHNAQELCGLLPMSRRVIVLVLCNHYVLLSSVTRRGFVQ